MDPTDFVKRMEGWNPRAYWDKKQWSIGYGTRASGPDEVIDEAEGRRRLATELDQSRSYVARKYPNLAPHQTAALTSFTYNLGPGWMNSPTRLRAAIESGDYEGAARVMREYNKAGGEVLPGLVKRRDQEAAFFLGGPTPAAGTAQPSSPAAATGAAPTMIPPMTPYTGPSPDDVAQQRRMAQMLMQQATSTEPVGHWTQALARVVQGGVGGMYRNAAQEGERQITDAGNTALMQALGSNDAKAMIPYLLGNPGTRQMGQQLLLEQAKRNMDPTAALEAERLRLSIESMKDDQAFRQKSRPIELEKTQAEVDRLKKPAATIKEVNGKLVQVLPDGTTKTLYDAGPNFNNLPEYAAKSSAFASRMVDAENNVRPLIAGTLQEPPDPKTGLSPLSRIDPNSGRAVRNFDPTSKQTYAMEFVPERIANMTVRGGQYQQYKQAAEQWIRAFLRKESGAAINKDEFNRDFIVYFPQPGDWPELVKQKENARMEAMKGFAGETRGFFEQNNPKAAERLKTWEGGVQPSARQPAAAPAGVTAPVRVSSPDEARRLPSGTPIMLPDGTLGKVP